MLALVLVLEWIGVSSAKLASLLKSKLEDF